MFITEYIYRVGAIRLINQQGAEVFEQIYTEAMSAARNGDAGVGWGEPKHLVHCCNHKPIWRARAPNGRIICVAFTYTSATFLCLSLRLLFLLTLIYTLVSC